MLLVYRGAGKLVFPTAALVLCYALVVLQLATQVSALPLFQQSPGQSDTNTYKLSGTVVNAITGEAIPRALVYLNGPTQLAVLTDSNGNFQFNGLVRSPQNVIAQKPGYFNEMELKRSGRLKPIPVGPETGPLILKLVPAAVLTGRVVNKDGEPLEQAQVALLQAQIVEGKRRWQQVAGAGTDEDGRYRVGNLQPGTYLISVHALDRHNFMRSNQSHRQGYPLQWFYPGVTERSAAQPVRANAGQSIRADLVLGKVPVFRVSGRVVLPPGVTSFSLNVVSSDGGPGGGIMRYLDSGFAFRDLPAGSYIFEARSAEGQTQFAAQLQLNVMSDINGIVLALAPAPAIPVVVNAELTKPDSPQPDVRPYSPVQVRLRSMDSDSRDTFARFERGHSSDLVVRDVVPGHYDVEFSGPPQLYVHAATCGTTDLLREPLVVTADAQVPPINVTLRDDGGTIVLHADGEVPEDGAQVLVFSNDAPTQPPKIAYIEPPLPENYSTLVAHAALNRPEIQGLAPGEYTLFAFDHIEDLEYANPEVMRTYLSHAAHVTVAANGKTTATVEVIRLGGD